MATCFGLTVTREAAHGVGTIGTSESALVMTSVLIANPALEHIVDGGGTVGRAGPSGTSSGAPAKY